jgi:putative PIN family toxin of toxin-antitoxin system
MNNIKIILDTNVLLVSISSKSLHHWIFTKLIEGVFDLGITSEILLEYEEIIGQKYNITVAKDVIRTLLVLPNVQPVTVYYKWNLIAADSDDNKFVDCAISFNADGIVTQDKHFNILKTISFPKVNLLSVAEFKSKIMIE